MRFLKIRNIRDPNSTFGFLMDGGGPYVLICRLESEGTESLKQFCHSFDHHIGHILSAGTDIGSYREN